MTTWKAQRYPKKRYPRKEQVKKYSWGLGGEPHQCHISHTEGTDGDFQVASHPTVGLIFLAEA